MGKDVVTIYTYMHHRTLLSYEKKEIMSFAATWMDLEMIILSEVSQTEKDKYCIISHIYTHTQNGILLSHKKKNEGMPLAATWMGLEMIILSEGRQTKTNII